VTTAAALPALAVPAAAASVEPDPIFEAIERHRRAKAAWTAAYEALDTLPHEKVREAGRACDDLSEVTHQELVALVRMTPTTIAGCAALLRHLEQHENEHDSPALFADYVPDQPVHQTDSTLLSRIAGELEA